MGKQTMDREGTDSMFCVKSHVSQGEVLVAACDAEILGRTFEEGDLQISVGEGFYGTDRVDEETLKRTLTMASIMNLIGERVVRLAIEMGLVDDGCVIRIGGVPHAQVLRLT